MVRICRIALFIIDCCSLFCLADLSVLRSNEDQVPVAHNKFMGDIEELAASYERKLIEVIAVFVSFIILCEVHSSAFQIFVFPKANKSQHSGE